MSNLVKLRRYDTSQPWGFRMNGGTEFGQPLYIQKVTPNSVSFRAGMRPGDGLLQIGSVPTQGMSHAAAKMEIIRAGNDVDFIIQRNVVPVGPPAEGVIPLTPRAESGNYAQYNTTQQPAHMDPGVQSRSFKILQQQLSHT